MIYIWSGLSAAPNIFSANDRNMSMNYANIKYYDIANGPGVRTSVFVSGCRHHCPGCFNAVAWDFDYGQPFDKTVRNEVFADRKSVV